MKHKYFFVYSFFLFFTLACATYAPQYKDVEEQSTLSRKQKPSASFYLIGDAGGAPQGGSTDALQALNKVLDTVTTSNAYTIFLGDNIYEEGLPDINAENRADAEHKLKAQLDIVADFNGKVVFIPGNHDWFGDGLKGLKRQEKFVEEALGKDTFLPENGCPIETVSVSDDIELLLIDTQWYLENWDKSPTMNDECEIRTRNEFFLEIESKLKKNNEKTILIAMHHPMYTNGVHGGAYAIEKHLFPFQSKLPLPGIATLITQIRSQGGVSPQDRANQRYDELMSRLETLAYDTNKAIFVSGHEHSLQYIDQLGIKQIVSGSGAKKSAALLRDNGLFAYGGQGFAVLDVYADGSSIVRYYGAKEGNPTFLFETEVHKADIAYDVSDLPSQFEPTKNTTAYAKEDTEKSSSYTRLWGDHYRYVYGTDIKVPVLTLDTLKGGITIDRKGGGHQTRSLRLRVNETNQNYALRAVKKSAVQFLQSVVFKDNFVQEEFRDTFTEDVILDFYTSSHPYASLAIGGLADAIDVYHTNPQLVWMPKHPALGKYNETYGDELYIIEERPDDGFLDVASFGKPDKIESTSDVLEHLRKDEKYSIDEDAFIKARLFDMLLGDWDRHADQWRWARFDTKGSKKYKPIPRDRDQAFSNYDGRLLDFTRALIPPARQFQKYDGTLDDIKWINIAGSKLDHALLPSATRENWLAQAKYIQENLTDTAIDNAFLAFPKEIQDDVLEDIKRKLKERRANIVDIAGRYYDHLSKLVIIKGTDKDDHFEITREADGTRVQVSRIKKGKVQEPFIDRLVSPSETNELWIYGLDDDDTFRVSGKGKKPIFTRIIGGQNNDTYTMDDGRKIKIYDHKTKPNTIAKRGNANIKKSNIYSHNTYDFNKTITKVNSVLPSIGFNPDDGVVIGLQDTYTVKGFKNDPFHRKHVFKAGYFFATSGFDFSYRGEFANSLGEWNLKVGARFTSENFALNFFGFGNETENRDDEEDLELDFNRVKTGIAEAHIGVVKDNGYGSRLAFSTKIERVEVEDTEGRFITQEFMPDRPDFFEAQHFIGVEGMYEYTSADNPANPSRGMDFELIVGSKLNLDNSDRVYGYIAPKLGFYNALSRNKKLVLKTLVQGQFNIGDSFEFYQGATLGARNGLRGFRNERFTGESALAGSADLRYSFNRFKTGLLPVQIGIFGGGDVGRVWLDGEISDTWHTSVGGGFWVNAVDMISGQFGVFNSDDGIRIIFGFGLRL